MTSRWAVLFALLAVVGLAMAGAATIDPSLSPVAGAAAVVAAPAPDTTPGDPYLQDSPFTTEAPAPMVSCSIYAYQCKSQGGPCGPGGLCHCSFNPGSGWVCAR